MSAGIRGGGRKKKELENLNVSLLAQFWNFFSSFATTRRLRGLTSVAALTRKRLATPLKLRDANLHVSPDFFFWYRFEDPFLPSITKAPRLKASLSQNRCTFFLFPSVAPINSRNLLVWRWFYRYALCRGLGPSYLLASWNVEIRTREGAD